MRRLPPVEATRLDGRPGRLGWVDRRIRSEVRAATGCSPVSTCRHRPSRVPFLICPPLHAEFTRNYRREVLLLAGSSWPRASRSSGSTTGVPETAIVRSDVTFDTMRDDAQESLEHLASACGMEVGSIVGARWGALVAAATASRLPGVGVVLWDPLVEASTFFRDAFRASRIQKLKGGDEPPAPGEDLGVRLKAGQAVDVVGYTIEGGLYASSLGRSLEGELGSSPRSVLLLQVGPLKDVRPDLAGVAERWRAARLDVEIQVIRGEGSWWLVDDRRQDEGKSSMTVELVNSTAAWIVARSGEEGPS